MTYVPGNEAATTLKVAKPWYKKKRFIIPIGLFAFFMIVSALGQSGSTKDGFEAGFKAGAATKSNGKAAASPVTSQAVVTTVPVTAAPTTTTAPVPETIVLPAVKGQNLAIVADKLDKLGLKNVQYGSVDEYDTLIILYANWTAVSIEPAAGTSVNADDAIVVKATKKK